MSEGIIIALITSIGTFLGVVISNFSSNKKLVNDVKIEFTKKQAITDTKIDELTYEVRKHNGFAEKIPKLEEQIVSTNKKIDLLHRKM